MSNKPDNDGKHWTDADLKKLEQLVRGNTPTRIIALKLERTPEAIQSKA